MSVELASRKLGQQPQWGPSGELTLAGYRVPGVIANTLTVNFAGGADNIPTYSLADLRACVEKGDTEYFRREFAGKVVLLGTLLDVEDRRVTTKRFATGGEQARVLAARAIAQDTPLLLADEPVAGLDPAHQVGMMRAFRALAARGRTIIVSLHDLTLGARWCDRLLLLKQGRLAADGKPEEVLTAGQLQAAFALPMTVGTFGGGLAVVPRMEGGA